MKIVVLELLFILYCNFVKTFCGGKYQLIFQLADTLLSKSEKKKKRRKNRSKKKGKHPKHPQSKIEIIRD